MKTLLALLLLGSIAFAGETVVQPSPTPSPQNWYSEDFFQTLFNARAASVVVYPSVGLDIKVNGKSTPFGFGMAVLYPVSEYAFAGGRLDFLGGNFWAPSAVVGAKYTLKNLPFTPTVFTVGGLIMPLGGAQENNHVVGAITGVGATAEFWKTSDGKFSIHGFIEGEKWTNFDGSILHFGVGGAYKF